MSRVAYRPTPAYQVANTLGRKWTPSLAIWGAGAGVMALYILSATPLVRREFLSKVPVIGSYWEDKTPASDKPF